MSPFSMYCFWLRDHMSVSSRRNWYAMASGNQVCWTLIGWMQALGTVFNLVLNFPSVYTSQNKFGNTCKSYCRLKRDWNLMWVMQPKHIPHKHDTYFHSCTLRESSTNLTVLKTCIILYQANDINTMLPSIQFDGYVMCGLYAFLYFVIVWSPIPFIPVTLKSIFFV